MPRLWYKITGKTNDFEQMFKSQMKGYNLKCHFVHIGAITFYTKPAQKPNGNHYKKKMSMGSMTFCIAQLDKSRRINSFVQMGSIYGCIIGIIAVCHERHEACKCVIGVVLCLEVYRLCTQYKLILYKLQWAVVFGQNWKHFENRSLLMDLVCKCLILDSGSATYLCALNEKYVPGAT